MTYEVGYPSAPNSREETTNAALRAGISVDSNCGSHLWIRRRRGNIRILREDSVLHLPRDVACQSDHAYRPPPDLSATYAAQLPKKNRRSAFDFVALRRFELEGRPKRNYLRTQQGKDLLRRRV